VRRGTGTEGFVAQGIADRVASYECDHVDEQPPAEQVEDELVEKAATLLLVMPPNQPRRTIEQLVSPHDPVRGERAVAALIESAFAVEDAKGRLRRV
jgi:hypothetical protein